MNTHDFQPDDPRLTAYALGELDGAEHAAVEELLAHSPEAQAAVDEILAVSGSLIEALRPETLPQLSSTQREAIYAQAATGQQSRDSNRVNNNHPLRLTTAGPVGDQATRTGGRFGLVAVAASLAAIVALGLLIAVSGPEPDEQQNSLSFTTDGVDGRTATELSDRMVAVDSAITRLSGNDPVKYFPEVKENPRIETAQSQRAAGSSGSIVTRNIPTLEPLEGQAPLYYTLDPLNSGSNSQSTVLGVTPRIIVQKEEGLDLGLPVADKSVSRNGSSPPAQYRGHRFSPDTGFETTLSRFGADTTEYEIKLAQPHSETFRFYVPFHSESLAEQPDFSDAYTFEYKVDPDKKLQAVVVGDQFYLVNVDTKKIWSFPKDKPEELQQAREAYAKIIDNPFVAPGDEPLSTFSIDVDTASYTNIRRFLNNGQLPPPDAVRIEEMVNYFQYDHPFAVGQYFNDRIKTEPFEVAMETGPAPWKTNHHLLRVVLQGHAVPTEARPAGQLVFLIDVSGSMKDSNKLPLVKQALRLLVEQLNEDDRIGIVTYSDTATVLLEPTNGGEKSLIMSAIDGLQAHGSTNGAAGLQMAYDLAQRKYEEHETTRRVIVCTDGDFNVGISDDKELVSFIEKQASETQIFLSVFGFGTGNIKDARLEQLADHGNGHYVYIDGFNEAKRVFVEELTGTLVTVAKDVKIQIEFNPAHVAEYRLIGYENRALAAQDFNDDQKDAGELGASQSVVALYEIVPVGVERETQPGVDELKYQKPAAADNNETENKPSAPSAETEQASNEMLTLKIRYKTPAGKESKKLVIPLEAPVSMVKGQPVNRDDPAIADGNVQLKYSQTSNLNAPESASGVSSDDFRWSAAVAAFGMLLRSSEHCNNARFDHVLEWGQAAVGEDQQGRRAEMLALIEKANVLHMKERRQEQQLDR